MQKYLSPAKRAMGRVLPHTADIKAFMLRKRLMVFGISVALLLVTLLGFVAVRGRNMNSMNNDAFTHEEHAQGSSVTTEITNENPAAISNGSGSSSTDTKTNVTVNNQQIPVPQNGTVSKTITNGNGSTTQVNISHNSSSSNDSGSFSSTSVSAHTSSQNINYHSP